MRPRRARRRLVLSRKGQPWKTTFAAAAETLPVLSEGPATLAFTADGETGSSEVVASLRGSALLGR